MDNSTSFFPLSTRLLDFSLTCQDQILSLNYFGLADHSGQIALPSSELFKVTIDHQHYSAANLAFTGGSFIQSEEGVTHFVASFDGPGFKVEQNIVDYPDSALLEIWPVVHNASQKEIHITRVDSFSIDLCPTEYDLLSFDSDWGKEFEPNFRRLSSQTSIETRFGHSSKGAHPWFALSRQEMVISGSVGWSGNWICRFEPLEGGAWRASGGLNDWNFTKGLVPGASAEFPHCMLAFGGDLNAVSRQFAEIGRKYWYPHSPLSDSLPLEWNHWWGYTDADIDEKTFLANVDAAAKLGIEVCTLDAGWFGSDQPGTSWFDLRGDWDVVNRQRFPSGIRFLSDYVHAKGLRFGLWCEIEGLGKNARLNLDHPEFAATRDGQPLGYVCLGSPAARRWAYETLHRLILEYACDWVKLDFNVDPLAGCSRTDHGHGSGDGLFEHVLGYYVLLDRLRSDFPQVVFEACSSGGLRIDLGLARHTHLTFLSDQDWPVHSLQVFWGASTLLAPDVCLHWSFSDWHAADRPATQNFNPHDPSLTPPRLDYYTRIAMLGACGLSQKLPNLPAWMSARLADLIWIYRQQVRRFVSQGVLTRLTSQPQRDGSGARWCAFQYSLPEEDQHLLFVFRLPGAQPHEFIRLTGLDPERKYTIDGFEGESAQIYSGSALVEDGLQFDSLLEEESCLLRVHSS